MPGTHRRVVNVGPSRYRTVVATHHRPISPGHGAILPARPRVGGCGSPPGTSTPSARVSTASRRSSSGTTSTCSRCQETKAREDQLPLMGLQAAGYDVAAAGTTSGTVSRSISRVGLDDVQRRLRRHARVRRPARGRGARDRRDVRRRTDLVALRPQRPQARRPALRLQARLAGPAARRGRLAGWTPRPRSSATGTSARPTPTSSTRRSSELHARHPAGARGVPGVPRRRVRRGHPRARRRGHTYWDYYRQRFERDRGLKIDFVLATPSLAGRVTGAFIDRDERAGTGRLGPRARWWST